MYLTTLTFCKPLRSIFKFGNLSQFNCYQNDDGQAGCIKYIKNPQMHIWITGRDGRGMKEEMGTS